MILALFLFYFKNCRVQSNLLESNPDFPQIWADKVDVLNYILSGYLARIDALVDVEDYQEELAEMISRSEFIKKELLITLDTAIEKFADENDWFKFKKEEFLEMYG